MVSLQNLYKQEELGHSLVLEQFSGFDTLIKSKCPLKEERFYLDYPFKIFLILVNFARVPHIVLSFLTTTPVIIAK